MAAERPVIHARDHGPGGPDPTFHAWDDVGTPGGGGGSGGITDITSADGSVTVTNPTGPTVDLSVPAAGFGAQQELLSAASATIASHGFATLSWSHTSGASLTAGTATNPTLVAAGIYLIIVEVVMSTAPAPPGITARLNLGFSIAFGSQTLVFEGGSGGGPSHSSLVWAGQRPASQGLRTDLTNDDASSRTYAGANMTVVRLA